MTAPKKEPEKNEDSGSLSQEPDAMKVAINQIQKLPTNNAFVSMVYVIMIPSKRFSPQQATLRDKAVTASTPIVGPTLILDALTEPLGLKKLLKSCLPDTYQQIIAMAHYLFADGGALSHCSAWCKSHAPLVAQSLETQRISEILSSITFDAKQAFLKK